VMVITALRRNQGAMERMSFFPAFCSPYMSVYVHKSPSDVSQVQFLLWQCVFFEVVSVSSEGSELSITCLGVCSNYNSCCIVRLVGDGR
jgi:hypothetical protein